MRCHVRNKKRASASGVSPSMVRSNASQVMFAWVLPVNKVIRYTIENITFPQLRWRAVKMSLAFVDNITMSYRITACTSGWYKYVSYCEQYEPVLGTRYTPFCVLLTTQAKRGK